MRAVGQAVTRHLVSLRPGGGHSWLRRVPPRAYSTATTATPLPIDRAYTITADLGGLEAIYTQQQNALQRSGHVADSEQMQRRAQIHVEELRPRVGEMQLRELSYVLKVLGDVRWYDQGLMQQLETRAMEVIRAAPDGSMGLSLADLATVLVRFAHLASGPLQLTVYCPGGTQPGELIEVKRENGGPLSVPVPYGAHLGKSFVHTLPAVLYSDLADLVLKLAGTIRHKNAKGTATFDVCRLSWAAAVLRRPELAKPLVVGLTRKDIERLREERETVGLTMLQQWLLGYRQSLGLSNSDAAHLRPHTVLPAEMQWLEDAAQAAFREHSEQLQSTSVEDDSGFQRQVMNAAMKLQGRGDLLDVFAVRDADGGCGLRRRPRREHVLESGLSADCAFPDALVAIEADGPHHFFWNDSDRPLAKTALKHELLRAEGWLLVAINSTEWHARDSSGQLKLLRDRIRSEEERTGHSQSALFELKRKERQEALMQLPDVESRFDSERGVGELVSTAASSSPEDMEDLARALFSGLSQPAAQQRAAQSAEQKRAEELMAARLEQSEAKTRAQVEEARAKKRQERARMRTLERAEREQDKAERLKRDEARRAYRDLLENDFTTSMQRDYSWVSECLHRPLDHEGVPVYVLGVNSRHPDCANQVWEVVETVGWQNTSVVFGCSRSHYLEAEDGASSRSSSPWYRIRTHVDEQVKVHKVAASTARRDAQKQMATRRRRNQKTNRSLTQQHVQFWCCGPDLRNCTFALDFLADPFVVDPSSTVEPNEELQLRKLDEQQMDQRLEEAQRIYRRWNTEQHDAEASSNSLLRYVQDEVRDKHSLAEADGLELDDEEIVGTTLRQLVGAGQSLEESRRAVEHRLRTLDVQERAIKSAYVGHVAGALQEVVVPALCTRAATSRARASGESTSPDGVDDGNNRAAVVVVLLDGDYHLFAEAWARPQTLHLPVDQLHPPSMLQQLIDIGILPHISAFENMRVHRKSELHTVAQYGHEVLDMVCRCTYVVPAVCILWFAFICLSIMLFVPRRADQLLLRQRAS